MTTPTPTVSPELKVLMRRLKLGRLLDTLPERSAPQITCHLIVRQSLPQRCSIWVISPASIGPRWYVSRRVGLGIGNPAKGRPFAVSVGELHRGEASAVNGVSNTSSGP